MEKQDFDKIVAEQIKAGEFLKAFDPVLAPFESLAKYGIGIASGFIGISQVFPQSPTTNDWVLFSSLVLFLGTITFGTLEIIRIMAFRDQMRRFSYVLLGDNPTPNDKKEAIKNIQTPVMSAIFLEAFFLILGIIVFILWVLLKINP